MLENKCGTCKLFGTQPKTPWKIRRKHPCYDCKRHTSPKWPGYVPLEVE